MEYLKIHENIIEKLDNFYNNDKIPNLLFYGPNGTGKRTLIFNFIYKIYDFDKNIIENCVLYVNCAQMKGIKYIREELKFFAKSNTNSFTKNNFKIIILSSAEHLTHDAQSALRRIIEIFSHNTRFFIITECKNKLLHPIISRFSQIYINHPVIKNNYINIHQFICNEKRKNYSLLKNKLDINNNNNYLDINDLIEISDYLFKKAITGIDLINYIIKYKYESKEKYRILLLLNKYKIYYRNEKLLIMYILYQIYFSLQIE